MSYHRRDRRYSSPPPDYYDDDYSDYYSDDEYDDDDGNGGRRHYQDRGRGRRPSIGGRLLSAIGLRKPSPDPPGYDPRPARGRSVPRGEATTAVSRYDHDRRGALSSSRGRGSYGNGYAEEDNRAYSTSSRSNRNRDRSRRGGGGGGGGGGGRDRWGQSLLAAADAAAIEAIRLRNEPGPWLRGPKATRIATAAAAAAAVEALLISRDEKAGRLDEHGGPRHAWRKRIEAAAGGLVLNRMVNGPRRNVR